MEACCHYYSRGRSIHIGKHCILFHVTLYIIFQSAPPTLLSNEIWPCICLNHTHPVFMLPFQTRDALKEKVKKQGFNIIHSVSFPTDESPQSHVQKLQVGIWYDQTFVLILSTPWNLLGSFYTPIGVKWKDHFPKLLPEVCSWDSLPSKLLTGFQFQKQLLKIVYVLVIPRCFRQFFWGP